MDYRCSEQAHNIENSIEQHRIVQNSMDDRSSNRLPIWRLQIQRLLIVSKYREQQSIVLNSTEQYRIVWLIEATEQHRIVQHSMDYRGSQYTGSQHTGSQCIGTEYTGSNKQKAIRVYQRIHVHNSSTEQYGIIQNSIILPSY